jgi:ubiquinone biosynthesis monooxygenase Coq7
MTMEIRNYSPLDRLLINLDQGLRTVFGRPQVTERKNPANDLPDAELSEEEKDRVARLMRINHTGEVCAQALYAGQALTARLAEIRDGMERAALEENDHLDWCERRIDELGNRKSYLNAFWYMGSFAIGAAAGLAGDKWSLGFVAETERQVEAHLDDHLTRIPPEDERTRAILEQMRVDEIGHATQAIEAGGAPLPAPIRLAMRLTSRVMTKTVYHL